MSNPVFEYADTQLEFTPHPWDTVAFQRACFEMTMHLGREQPSATAVVSYLTDSGMDAVVCRVDARDRQPRSFLRSMGFFHVELQLKCKLALNKIDAPSIGSLTLRRASEADAPAVQTIARTAFLQTRFRDLTGVTDAMIAARFGNWAKQLQDEHPQLAYVLEYRRKSVAFFYSQPTETSGELFAALGAVSPDHRGPFGLVLYPAVMAAYRQAGYETVVSAVAADNLGAVNRWAELGTQFPRAVDFFLWNRPT